MNLGLSAIAALLIATFDLPSVVALLLLLGVVALVKVISKRPEFDGLPAPPPK